MRRSQKPATKRPGGPSPRPPGRAGVSREAQRQFWAKIAEGMPSRQAGIECGASAPTGSRLFRESGGMPPIDVAPPSGRYLSSIEREELALLHATGCGVRKIAERLDRSPSTISRELRRNRTTRGGGRPHYRASIAQRKAERAARRPKLAKLAGNQRLRDYVQERLAGEVEHPDGAPVPGPAVGYGGRGRGRGTDRPWSSAWSPEQISNRLKLDFPDDESMSISHEAIYQALFIQGRGALKRELTACLRTGRTLRVPRARARVRSQPHVTDELMISERPAEVEDRALSGNLEGDLIIGSDGSAIGTLIERTTRYTLLLYLPRMEGYGESPPTKNGPAFAGHGAKAVRDAITKQISRLPEQLRKTLTWDQGIEMAEHAKLSEDTGIEVYFCDPRSPWQRGTNENTNGLLRQYFPKGTDLSRHSARDLEAVAHALNNRPRKTLGWKTPAEALEEQLSSLN